MLNMIDWIVSNILNDLVILCGHDLQFLVKSDLAYSVQYPTWRLLLITYPDSKHTTLSDNRGLIFSINESRAIYSPTYLLTANFRQYYRLVTFDFLLQNMLETLSIYNMAWRYKLILQDSSVKTNFISFRQNKYDDENLFSRLRTSSLKDSWSQ